MANVKFTKTGIKALLKSDFKKKYNAFKKKNRTNKCYFSNGVQCKTVDRLVNYFFEHEGNYHSLNAEIEREFKSLLE
jgi:hypothetical protein